MLLLYMLCVRSMCVRLLSPRILYLSGPSPDRTSRLEHGLDSGEFSNLPLQSGAVGNHLPDPYCITIQSLDEETGRV